MARLKLNVRIGRSMFLTQKEKVVVNLDSRNNPAVEQVRTVLDDKLMNAVEIAAADQLETRLRTSVPRVLDDLRLDLERYAVSVLRFFFTRQSSTSGRPLVIRLAEVYDFSKTSGFGSGLGAQGAASGSDQVVWPALAGSTLMKKGWRPGHGRSTGDLRASPTTYFVHSSNLQEMMAEILPGFLQKTLSPGIQVTFEDVEGQQRSAGGRRVSREKVRVATIEATIATINQAGMSPNRVSFLRGEIFHGKAIDTALLKGYLNSQIHMMTDDIAMKLENARYPDKQRPWLEPAMAFWVLRRFAYVFQRSLQKHIREKV